MSNFKRMLAGKRRMGSGGVSPVIATILMVAITVVLAAVLYVMVLGFGLTSPTPSIAVTRVTATSNGYTIDLSNPTSPVMWGDVAILLSDGTNTVTWKEFTTIDLTSNGAIATWHSSAPQTLGDVQVSCTIADLVGNGAVNGGDMIIFSAGSATAFSQSGSYTLTLIYEQTSSAMLSGAELHG